MRLLLKFIFLTITLFTNHLANGQEEANKYYLKVFGATEPVDDRLIGLTESRYNKFKTLNEETHPDKTKYWGIGFGYNLFSRSNFFLDVGLNYAFERNNYIRPFNHCVLVKKGDICTDELRSLDKYNYNLLGINFTLNYNIKVIGDAGFKVGIDLTPYSKFLSYYKEALVTDRENYLWKLNLFSLEVNPYLGIFYENFEIDIAYRIWQFKKVDRAIHPKWSDGFGQIENDYESYNPQKIEISLKYRFDFKKN